MHEKITFWNILIRVEYEEVKEVGVPKWRGLVMELEFGKSLERDGIWGLEKWSLRWVTGVGCFSRRTSGVGQWLCVMLSPICLLLLLTKTP